MVDTDRYVCVKEVATRFGVAVSSIWRWAKEGSFPKPTRLGHGTTRWLESEVLAFEAERRADV